MSQRRGKLPDEIGGLNAYPFEMSQNVSAGSDETNELSLPFDGRIRSVVLGWQAGANNKVGVGVRTRTGKELIPRNSDEDYIAADDFTYPFLVREEVSEDDIIVAEFNNTDTTNDHFINVFVEVVELPPSERWGEQ